MSDKPEDRDEAGDPRGRPPRAVVGSHRPEEEVFGAAFDGRIVRRIWQFVYPYRRKMIIAVAAVLLFTLSQVAIPLIIRFAIDHGMATGSRGALTGAAIAFAAAILVNYGASWVQETVVGKAAEDVLFDMRRAMFAHLQRVSLSFMDKTEVGRLMSRLQGDVNSMQEFMETSVLSVGDIALLAGIITVMLLLDVRLALLTLSVMPVLFVVRLWWLPRARDAFMAAHETNSVANGALAEGIHGVRTVQSMGRQQLNLRLYDDKAHGNLRSHLRAAKYAQVMVPIVDTLTGVAMAVVIVVGGSMVLGNTLDIGIMVAFLFYIQRFFDPDPFADPAVQRHAAGHGLGPPHRRGARHSRGDRGPAGCDRPVARHGRIGRVQGCDLRLSIRPTGAQECELPRQSGRNRRPRRPHGLGKVERDGARASFLRCLGRPGDGRRP